MQFQPVGMSEKKNSFKLNYLNTQLTISGNFDSGNLSWAGVNAESNEIQLLFGRDKDIKGSAKCWFYFSISGSYKYLPVKLNLLKTNSLSIVSKIYDLYRPVVKVQGGEWDRHSSPVQFQITPDNDINFTMSLELYGSKTFYVALCYPWSINENDEYLHELEKSLWKRNDIYFNRQTLIYSPQKRPIDIIALSSAEVRQLPQEDYIEHLFPNREQKHFKRIAKPLIMITSRVHPSEVGSSYSLMGMIQYLTSGKKQANKMLSQFYFLIIPILNPDGVYLGNNRLDALGQNLNRFYLMPDLQSQPSCFAVKSIIENTRLQLYAFFDLHGHQNKKSCFLFGNSINNQNLQIESILFAKYLSQQCPYVQFKSCNFSKKQMSSKDKNEDLSKQGCARVVVHKWTNSPYCYTLQTGIFKNVKVDDKGIERYGEQFYNPAIYKNVGEKMLTSLYAVIGKGKRVEEMRKQITAYVLKMQKISSKKQLRSASGKNCKKEKTISNQGKDKKEGKQTVSLVDVTKRPNSQKQNELFEQKIKGIEKALNRNKLQLLGADADDDDQY